MTSEDRSCARCGGPVTTAGEDQCSDCTDETIELESQLPHIPGHRMIRLLGVGGMGRVYLAEDEALGRCVAVKLVSRDLSEDREAHKRFVREARNLARIEHPYIVRVYSFGTSEVGDYFAMEYVNGTSLEARIRKGPLSVADSIQVVRQCVEALDAAHKEGVIHRDIKPANILLDQQGDVRVADFGLAKSFRDSSQDTSSLTGSRRALGTPKYIAPEQARGDAVDFRADIYSLGVVWYEMLTGEPPFRGRTPFTVVEQHLRAEFPSVGERRKGVSPGVESLIAWMTRKRPEERPNSYAALSDVLNDLDATDCLTSPAPPRLEIARRFLSSLRRMPRGGGRLKRSLSWKWLAILVVLVSGGLWAWLADPPPQTARETTPQQPFVVAVTRFYGPDEESSREGALMGAMIERAARSRFEPLGVKVIGIEEAGGPVRNNEEARRLGGALGASTVVWGEAFSARGETEVLPKFTFIPSGAPRRPEHRLAREDWLLPLELAAGHGAEQSFLESRRGALISGDQAGGQIELRRMSADGINDVVLILAGVHALLEEGDADKAIKLLEDCPESSEVFRLRAQAHLANGDRGLGKRLVQDALALDPDDSRNHALLGDLAFEEDDLLSAAEHYSHASRISEWYTTSYGVIYGGKLFCCELAPYAMGQPSRLFPGPYMLVRDPSSLKVTERYRLPGRILGFQYKPEGFEVRCERYYQYRYPDFETLSWTGDGFDKPLWLGPGYQDRVAGIKTGLQLAWNFLNSYWVDAALQGGAYSNPRMFGQSEGAPGRNLSENSRFRFSPPTSDVDARFASTYRELDSRLTASIAGDPTQAWYSFLLGMSKWAQGYQEAAEDLWELTFNKESQENPYYEFAYMAHILEELGLTAWADRAFLCALLERSKSPQPVAQASDIEMYFNAPFLRSANRVIRLDGNAERGYQWLHRSRTLVGWNPLVADLESASWENFFRHSGDAERADVEKELKEQYFAGSPFRVTTHAAAITYGLIGLTTLWLTFISFLVASVGRSGAKGSWGPLWLGGLIDGPSLAAVPWFLAGLSISLSLLGVGFSALSMLSFYAQGYDGMRGFTIAGLVILAAGLAIMPRGKVDGPGVPSNSPKSRPSSPKIAGALSLLMGVSAVVCWYAALQFFQRGDALRSGWSDSLGHAQVVAALERDLEHDHDEGIVFSTAVANHLAGNFDRAAMLYREVTGRHRWAASGNLRLAEQGVTHSIVMPSAEDLYEPRLSFNSGNQMISFVSNQSVLLWFLSILWAFVLGVALAFHRITKTRPDGGFRSRINQLSGEFIPGIHDLKAGSLRQGLVTQALCMVAPATCLYWLSGLRGQLSWNPLSVFWNPAGHIRIWNVLAPEFQTDGPVLSLSSDFLLMTCQPGFWPMAALLVLLTAAGVILHLKTLVRMRYEHVRNTDDSD